MNSFGVLGLIKAYSKSKKWQTKEVKMYVFEKYIMILRSLNTKTKVLLKINIKSQCPTSLADYIENSQSSLISRLGAMTCMSTVKCPSSEISI